jgi:hypothetical protein
MQNFQSKFNQELQQCNNMGEVLDCVQRHYDLTKPFGVATKIMVIGGINKILKLIQAVAKKL